MIILFLAFHTYLGYPAVLWIIGRKRPHLQSSLYRPKVSLLVAAYNEIDVIEAKIRNSFALEYPKELLEYVFVSDGSDDGTTEVIKKHENQRFHSVIMAPRGGKARALRKGMAFVNGDIVILSDANTMITKEAVHKLVRHFEDPFVGAVSGDTRIEKSSGGFGESESLLFRIERFIQKKESEAGSMIGVDGAMYAIRRELFLLPDDHAILDDLVISMNIIKLGRRIIYDPEALASENFTSAVVQEIRRKSRIAAGGFQALLKYNIIPRLTGPWLLFCFLSHKMLRFVMPLLLLLFVILNFAIVFSGGWWGYSVLLAAQAIFYMLGGIGWLKEREWKSPMVSVPFYFTMTNVAGIWGFIRFLSGSQRVTWKKADRVVDSGSSPPT